MTSVQNVKKQAMNSAKWVTFTYLAQQVIRLIGNVVLTRLLAPELFGLMSVANDLRVGLELFSDVGTTQSVIQNSRGDDPIFLRTAWTVQALRGLLIFGVFILITVLVVPWTTQDWRWFLVLPIVGLTAVFDGLRSEKLFTFRRYLKNRELGLFFLFSQVFAVVMMVIWAWFDPSIRALTLGGAIAPLAAMLYTYIVFQAPFPKPMMDRESLAALVSFGRWIFISSVMMFLAERSSRFLLLRLTSLSTVGVYAIAFELANMPRTLIKNLSSSVLFPALSLKNQLPREELHKKIAKQRWLMLLGTAGLLSIIVCTGDLIIAQLYDKRYIDATWMMPILCAGIWFVVLFYTLSPALLAVGKPKFVAFSNFTSFMVLLIGMPLAFHYFDLVGTITVISFSDFVPYFILLIGLLQEKLLFLWQDLISTLLFLGLVGLLLLVRGQIGFGTPLDNLFT